MRRAPWSYGSRRSPARAGDLWTVNTMIAAGAPEPTITGVLDLDRTLWGDPATDWSMHVVSKRQDERVAFWDGYGEPDRGPAATWRSLVYEVRHFGAIRLERHRLANADGVRDSHEAVTRVLSELT